MLMPFFPLQTFVFVLGLIFTGAGGGMRTCLHGSILNLCQNFLGDLRSLVLHSLESRHLRAVVTFDLVRVSEVVCVSLMSSQGFRRLFGFYCIKTPSVPCCVPILKIHKELCKYDTPYFSFLLM